MCDIERFSALLFDLDGTLVDSMPLHYRAYAEVLAQRGYKLEETDFMMSVGGPARSAILGFLEAAGMKGATAEVVNSIHSAKKLAFERLLSERAPVPLPAALLLGSARGRQKIALVSSGNRSGVMALLSAMGWTSVFDVIISGDDVLHGKPHPEPYLAAAAALSVAPHDCLVVEDTEAGFQSARAAGMTVLDVAKLNISK